MGDEKSKRFSVHDEVMEYIAHFYKYAFVGVLLDWVRHDMSESPESIVEKVSKIVGGTIEIAFKNFGK